MATKLFDTVVSYDTPGTLNIDVPAAQDAQINLNNIGNSVTVTFPASATEGQCIGVNVSVQDSALRYAVTLLGPIAGATITLLANEDSVLYTWDPDAPGAPSWVLVTKHQGLLSWPDAATRQAAYRDDNMGNRVGLQSDMDLYYQLLGDPSLGAIRWAPLPDPGMGMVYNHGAQNSTTTTVGLAQMSVTFGTATSRTQAATNALTKLKRTSSVSAAGAGSTAVIRTNSTQGGGFVGGFRWRTQFGLAVTSAACWWFVGFSDTIPGAAGADPATFLDCVGVGRSAADANAQLMHNDGAGAVTKIDLGAAFPALGPNLAYELELYSYDGTSFAYQVTNLSTGDQISGTFNTNLPKLTPIVGSPLYYLANNTNAVAVDLCYANQQFWARVA